jgi:hypothetical protein
MPALYDAENPGCVSNVGGSFVAGILQHLPALIAFTAPSPISGLRLLPHQWSASYTWFGNQGREASLRICPVPRIGKSDPAKAFNIEYRPAGSTACPHLALGVMVRAGLEGIREKLAAPELLAGDPTKLTAAQRIEQGLHPLPSNLPSAYRQNADGHNSHFVVRPSGNRDLCGYEAHGDKIGGEQRERRHVPAIFRNLLMANFVFLSNFFRYLRYKHTMYWNTMSSDLSALSGPSDA